MLHIWILLRQEYLIVIGNNVAIAPEVKIFSASHDYQDISLPDYGEGIYIEDYVWIGGGAIILPGVKIGKGSVIGAGSIVTHDIPDWSVAVGNPARVIKKRVLNEREVFNKLIPEINRNQTKKISLKIRDKILLDNLIFH